MSDTHFVGEEDDDMIEMPIPDPDPEYAPLVLEPGDPRTYGFPATITGTSEEMGTETPEQPTPPTPLDPDPPEGLSERDRELYEQRVASTPTEAPDPPSMVVTPNYVEPLSEPPPE